MEQRQKIQLSENQLMINKMKSSIWLVKPLIAWQTCPARTIKQAIAYKTSCLGLLLKTEQTQTLKDLLFVAISEVSVFFNVGKNLTPQQINSTIDLILNDNACLNLSFEDYKVCFEFAKKGHYGKAYDRIDGQIIFEWIYQYSTDKTNEYLRIKDFNEKQAQNQKITPGEVNKEGQLKVAEAMRQALKSVEAPKVDKPAREKSAYEKMIQRFLTQFQKIAIKRGLNSDTKYIFMYGKNLTCSEYMEMKVKQYNRVMKILIQ